MAAVQLSVHTFTLVWKFVCMNKFDWINIQLDMFAWFEHIKGTGIYKYAQ